MYPILRFLFLPSHFGVLVENAGILSSSETKTHWQCIGYVANVFYNMYQAFKILSGGDANFDFMVSMFTGDKGCRRVESLRTSTARGLEFKMPSTSVIIVNKGSSSIIPEWNLQSESVTPKPHPYDLPKEGSCAI